MRQLGRDWYLEAFLRSGRNKDGRWCRTRAAVPSQAFYALPYVAQPHLHPSFTVRGAVFRSALLLCPSVRWHVLVVHLSP